MLQNYVSVYLPANNGMLTSQSDSWNNSSDILEIMFDGNAFSYLVVNVENIFLNVLDENII